MGMHTDRMESSAMVTAKDEVREALERLTDDEAAEMLALVRKIERRRERERIFEQLRGIPTFRVPDPGAPDFRRVVPIDAPGKPASEMLIEDRR
jgi:hypothetical protein